MRSRKDRHRWCLLPRLEYKSRRCPGTWSCNACPAQACGSWGFA